MQAALPAALLARLLVRVQGRTDLGRGVQAREWPLRRHQLCRQQQQQATGMTAAWTATHMRPEGTTVPLLHAAPLSSPLTIIHSVHAVFELLRHLRRLQLLVQGRPLRLQLLQPCHGGDGAGQGRWPPQHQLRCQLLLQQHLRRLLLRGQCHGRRSRHRLLLLLLRGHRAVPGHTRLWRCAGC